MIVERLLKVALLGSSWILYLLLALSVVSITAMLERVVYFRKATGDGDALRRDVEDALLAGDLARAEAVLAKDTSVSARVIARALAWRQGGASAVGDAVDSELGHARRELERGMTLLGTLGNNAPFVGLLGTVLGVIEAFNQLGANSGGGAMGNVMAGIAEALVATGVGLFVALPAVVAFNLAQKRIGEIEGATVALAKLFTAFLTTRDKGGVAVVAVAKVGAREATKASAQDVAHGARESAAPAAGAE